MQSRGHDTQDIPRLWKQLQQETPDPELSSMIIWINLVQSLYRILLNAKSKLFPSANLHATHAEIHLDLLALLFADLHLAAVECPQCDQTLASHFDHARASDPPHVDAHAAQRRAREAKQPLDVVRCPALRNPEERLLREPELDDEARARSTEPTEGRGDAIEVGAEGLEGLRCEF